LCLRFLELCKLSHKLQRDLEANTENYEMAVRELKNVQNEAERQKLTESIELYEKIEAGIRYELDETQVKIDNYEKELKGIRENNSLYYSVYKNT